MKIKFTNNLFRQRKELLKFIMRTFIFLLCSTAFGFTSGEIFSQKTKIQIDRDQLASIDEVFDLLRDQTDYTFIYQEDLFKNVPKVRLKKGTIRANKLLETCFSGKDFKLNLNGNKIVIIPTHSSSEERQTLTISGKVLDTEGHPLPGANIIEKGTTNGTQADFDGNFTIEVKDTNAILVFSYIGFASKEVVLNEQTELNVTLSESAAGLDEVVVVGYGTQKRQAVTGAVAVADLETYREVPVNNVLETVKGTLPGLNVGSVNTAGAVAGLSIRGQNSSSASNTPLIVVDGAIFNGSLADIAANDIENLTVLKDASAAAVYGSRSANGVILIDTKKGRGIDGKPRFDVKFSNGMSNQLKPLEVYDAEGYLQRILDIRANQGLEADPNRIRFYLQEEELKNYDATADHRPTLIDAFDLINQAGYIYNTTVSVANSTENTNYYIAGTLVKQKGVVINDEYKNISGRVNIDSDLTDWFNLGVKSFYSLRDYSGDSPGMYRATHFSPYASVYNDDGSYKQFPQSTTSFNSPFWEIATEDTDIRNNLSGVITSVIKIPWVKGLTYQTTFSNTLRWDERNEFFDKNTIDGKGKNGIGRRTYSRYYNMLFDNFLKYNNSFNKHNVDVTLLFSKEHSSSESLYAYAEDFDNTTLGTYALENGTTQIVNTGGGETDARGLMARATYGYDNRYSLTGTVRRDGYSAFSKNKKWGVFPSVGFNWNISNENFMANVDKIDNLSLRLSYGSNGNQSISAYSTLAKVSTSQYIFNGLDSYALTQYISSLANDNLGWETTTGTNLGLDFGFFNNRVRGSIDAYSTKTNDLIFNLSLPLASGNSSINSNIGEIQNKGIEVNLSTLNVDKENFKWYSDFAFSLNRNKVASILGKDNDGDGKEDDLINDGYFIGESLGSIYTYDVTGIWQQENVDNGSIMAGMRPGDFILEDIDGDGTISSDKDRQIIGNSNPNFRWSWTNTLKYKNLSLMLYFYSIWGGNDWYLSGNNDPYNDGYVGAANINRPVYDYWTPTNTNAEFPSTDYGNAPFRGTKYIDRSFIKLQKVALTYDVTEFVKPWGLNGLSFSLSADNLATYAPHWNGLDPETDSGLSDTAIPSIRTVLLSMALSF
tara:strand:- start:35767 stop:39099 length:3333 start_codon:yes stop_codon:yes gene_type:complete